MDSMLASLETIWLLLIVTKKDNVLGKDEDELWLIFSIV